MTKRKGSRRRDKKWEMGGIGSGTKSIKRLKISKICDYEHQKNKLITFFESYILFIFLLQFTTMILQTSPLFYEWKKKEGTLQNPKAEVSIWHRKIMVVATKWTSFFVLGLVFLTENADNDRNQDQRNSKWQKIESWKRDTND